MNEDCTPFELPTTQPSWATISQVSSRFHINYHAVRAVVRRAFQRNESWVKKVGVTEPRILIDTTHQTYQTHLQRWLHNTTFQPHKREPDHWFPSPGNDAFHEDVPNDPPSTENWLAMELTGLHFWPALQQWLHELGVQVFLNVLSEECGPHQWHWQWRGLQCEGYESAEQAIIAALQRRFDEDAREIQTLREQLAQSKLQEAPTKMALKHQGIFHWGGNEKASSS